MTDYRRMAELRGHDFPRQGYCTECGKECSVVVGDNGIGPYEFWGAKGNHHDFQPESACCEAQVVEFESDLPNQEEKMQTITEAQGEAYIRKVVELEQPPTCPVCDSKCIVWKLANAQRRDYLEIEVSTLCQSCNAIWTETYTLSAIYPRRKEDA